MFQTAAQKVRQVLDPRPGLFRRGAHQRPDRAQRVEQEMRIHLRLQHIVFRLGPHHLLFAEGMPVQQQPKKIGDPLDDFSFVACDDLVVCLIQFQNPLHLPVDDQGGFDHRSQRTQGIGTADFGLVVENQGIAGMDRLLGRPGKNRRVGGVMVGPGAHKPQHFFVIGDRHGGGLGFRPQNIGDLQSGLRIQSFMQQFSSLLDQPDRLLRRLGLDLLLFPEHVADNIKEEPHGQRIGDHGGNPDDLFQFPGFFEGF